MSNRIALDHVSWDSVEYHGTAPCSECDYDADVKVVYHCLSDGTLKGGRLLFVSCKECGHHETISEGED